MTNKEMIEPWRQYGVRLEKEDTVDGVTHLYISVPKMSDFSMITEMSYPALCLPSV